MKGTESKLVEYMEGSKKRFVIPVYQRTCDWKTENCKQLYDDLIKVIKNDRKSHFFGSVVSVYNPDGRNTEFLVIDGQQRLATVSLQYRCRDFTFPTISKFRCSHPFVMEEKLSFCGKSNYIILL